MPIYWRYVLSHFSRLFLSCFFALLALLFLTRFHEATQLFALGANLSSFGLFILYQFPYIFPIAIPASCLIASYLTMQSLCSSGSVLALRAIGFSLQRLITPILFIAALFSVLNLFLVSESAPNCHLATKQLIRKITLQNPRLLLKKGLLLTKKGRFFEQSSVPMIAAAHIKTGPVLYLMDDLLWQEEGLSFPKSALVGVYKNSAFNYDTLIMEKSAENLLLLSPLESQWLIKEARVLLKPDHLNARLLLAKAAKSEQREQSICYSELIRRVNFFFLPLTFSLLGCSLGIFTSRERSFRRLLLTIVLTLVTLTGTFLAKHCASNIALSILVYLLPQALSIGVALNVLHRRSLGVGS